VTSEDDVVRHTKGRGAHAVLASLHPHFFRGGEWSNPGIARALTAAAGLLLPTKNRGCAFRGLASLLTLVDGPKDGWLTPYEGVYRIPTHHLVHVWPDGGSYERDAFLAPLRPADGNHGRGKRSTSFRARLTRVIERYCRRKAAHRHSRWRRRRLERRSGDEPWRGARSASGPENQKRSRCISAVPVTIDPYMRDLVDALGIVPHSFCPRALPGLSCDACWSSICAPFSVAKRGPSRGAGLLAGAQ